MREHTFTLSLSVMFILSISPRVLGAAGGAAGGGGEAVDVACWGIHGWGIGV